MYLKDAFNLSGKTAVVTGGYTGLGKQMACALAELGANLVLAARSGERCEEVAAELSQLFGVKALGVRCDVTKEEDIVNMVNRTMETFDRLDILVNNAGISWAASAADYPMDKWRQVFDVNLTGVFMAAKEAFRIMKQQGKGKIINVASILGLVGCKTNIVDSASYNASKGAVVNMTRDLAAKWAPFGVNVNALCPGWFPTHMTRKLIEMRRNEFLEYIPAGRFGSDKDLKGAIAYLASDASDYMYGQVLVVDGGWSIH